MYLGQKVNVQIVLLEIEYSGLSLIFVIELWESSRDPIKGTSPTSGYIILL